ncbi:MAG: hypothetical protein CDV28_10181 [Candidatus Electronema aureum]|uniref:Uncharacterized protein n=1 Tax=Candidatus Electronema aureum TaxID=2005002 RepID=A0A521G5A8_9BACT|nr:MAG: hypothetical protein CDV28_10181 [Candidatus Electronema aureum]
MIGDIMNELLALVVIGVLAFIAFNILIAALKGIWGAGKKIRESAPSFFEKVFYSMAAAAVGGIIVAVFTGTDFRFTGAATIGVFIGTFIKESLSS